MRTAFHAVHAGQVDYANGYDITFLFRGPQELRDHIVIDVGMSPKEVAEKLLELAARLDSRT